MEKSKAYARGYERAFGTPPPEAEVVEAKVDIEVKLPEATLPSEEAMAAVAEEEAQSEEE